MTNETIIYYDIGIRLANLDNEQKKHLINF
jgi:hypothetical protein